MTRRTSTLPALAATLLAVVAATSGCAGADAKAGASTGEVKELRYQGWANTATLPELARDLG